MKLNLKESSDEALIRIPFIPCFKELIFSPELKEYCSAADHMINQGIFSVKDKHNYSKI